MNALSSGKVLVQTVSERTRWLVWQRDETRRRKLLEKGEFCCNYLLSYPRSGNHAVRFALELLSGQPTLGEGDHESYRRPLNKNDPPIFLRQGTVNIPIHSPVPIALKRHRLYDIDQVDKLILIWRNPVEAVLSHKGASSESALRDGILWCKEIRDHYETLSRNSRLLIEFEEILTGGNRWIFQLAEFLEIPCSEMAVEQCYRLLSEAKQVLKRPASTESLSTYTERFPTEAAKLRDFVRQVGLDP